MSALTVEQHQLLRSKLAHYRQCEAKYCGECFGLAEYAVAFLPALLETVEHLTVAAALGKTYHDAWIRMDGDVPHSAVREECAAYIALLAEKTNVGVGTKGE